MATIDVDIEHYLDEVVDSYLIAELEHRGYKVIKEDDDPPLEELTKEELDHLCDMVINGKPGSIEWYIYEKIKKSG